MHPLQGFEVSAFNVLPLCRQSVKQQTTQSACIQRVWHIFGAVALYHFSVCNVRPALDFDTNTRLLKMGASDFAPTDFYHSHADLSHFR